MPTNYTPTATSAQGTTIQLPSDGDNANAESANLPMRKLADRTQHARARIESVITGAGLALDDAATPELADAIDLRQRRLSDARRIKSALGGPWRVLSAGATSMSAVAVSDGYAKTIDSVVSQKTHTVAIAAVKNNGMYTGNAMLGVTALPISVTGNLRAVAIRDAVEAVAVGDAGITYYDGFSYGGGHAGSTDATISGSPNLDEIIYDPINNVYWATGTGGIFMLAPPFDITADWSLVTNVGYKYPLAMPSGRVLFVRRSDGKIRYVDSALSLTFHEGPSQDEAYICAPIFDTAIGAAVYVSSTKFYKVTDSAPPVRSDLATKPSAITVAALFRFRGQACLSTKIATTSGQERVFATHDGYGAIWAPLNPSTVLVTGGEEIAGCDELVVIADGGNGLLICDRLL